MELFNNKRFHRRVLLIKRRKIRIGRLQQINSSYSNSRVHCPQVALLLLQVNINNSQRHLLPVTKLLLLSSLRP